MLAKNYLAAAFAVAVLGVTFFIPDVTVRADDMPYGYSVVDEKPEKGEKSRTKTLNTKKELVGRKIVKDDDTTQLLSYDSNGKKTQMFVYGKDGKRQSEFYYYPDGPIKREVVDGVLRFERRKLADGTFEAIRYKPDGKSPQMRRRVGANPMVDFELTHYRTGKSNKVWFTAVVKGVSGEFEHQYFAEDGSHLRRVLKDKQMVVTVYDTVGNFKLEQVWAKQADGSYKVQSASVKHNSTFRRYSVDDKGAVTKVEDFDSDGVTVKYTWTPDQVAKPDASLFGEQFEDDDPTIPEKE